MRILFLLLQLPDEGKGSNMYLDLALEFLKNGHKVTIMAPDNTHSKCYEINQFGIRIIRVNSLPTQGVSNLIKKGIGLATLGFYYKRAYKRFLGSDIFDWIFMPTPPITLAPLAEYIKLRTGSKFYLILRDIHPQSVWSIGLLKYKWMYNYLEKKAIKGYSIADKIGCMSQGNIDFVSNLYPKIDKSKFILLYNWLKASDSNGDSNIRERYNLKGKFVALFGGTIGLGQRIENILFLAEHYVSKPNIVFMIIGKGVEKDRLVTLAKERNLTNIQVFDFMPQNDYLSFVQSVDLGLISINEDYAVPTCPSKAISYMSLGIPILAMINPNSDYGQWIEDAGAGYWVVGADKTRTIELFDKLYDNPKLRIDMGNCGRKYYLENCTPDCAYSTIINQIEEKYE